MNTYLIKLTSEELEELIHLTSFASCDDNLASRLFDRLNQAKLVQASPDNVTNFTLLTIPC